MKISINSAYVNISPREFRSVMTRLTERGISGLVKFDVAIDLMTANPRWFSDELLCALDDHFFPTSQDFAIIDGQMCRIIK